MKISTFIKAKTLNALKKRGIGNPSLELSEKEFIREEIDIAIKTIENIYQKINKKAKKAKLDAFDELLKEIKEELK